MTARVTREKHNVPYLRGTGLPVSAIQSWAAAGHSVDRIRSEYAGVLSDWTDDDLAMALTYPRIGWTIYTVAPVKVVVDKSGDIELVGWFRVADVTLVLAAIDKARLLCEAWVVACDVWEADHR